jgi:hypothetical protein
MWSNMYRLVWFLQQSYVKPVRRRERHLTPPDTLLCTIILLLTRCWRTRASAVVVLQQTPVPWLLRPGRAEKSLTRQSADGQSAGVEESEICGTARVRRDLITFASFAHRHPVSSCWTISMSSTCTTIRCPSMAVSHSHQCRHAQTQMAYSYTAMSSSAWLYRSTYSTTHSTVTVAAAAVKQLGPTGVALAKVCAERYCYATMQRPALFSESRVQAIQKFQSRGSPRRRSPRSKKVRTRIDRILSRFRQHSLRCVQGEVGWEDAMNCNESPPLAIFLHGHGQSVHMACSLHAAGLLVSLEEAPPASCFVSASSVCGLVLKSKFQIWHS